MTANATEQRTMVREPMDLNTLSALMEGDRWLGADACSVFLGLFKDGKPNRRAFYEKVANQPGFPPPLVIGVERKWRKSEVDLWSLDERIARQIESCQVKEPQRRGRRSRFVSPTGASPNGARSMHPPQKKEPPSEEGGGLSSIHAATSW